MYIAESSFPHLVAANDARLVTELERRRIAAERRVESTAAATAWPSHRITARRELRRQVVDPAGGACATA